MLQTRQCVFLAFSDDINLLKKTVSVILYYRASTEETFKSHSVGRTAKDMHRSLWRKHDYRVRHENQQAHRTPDGCMCECQICSFHNQWGDTWVSATLRGKWKEHLGLQNPSEMRHLPFGKRWLLHCQKDCWHEHKTQSLSKLWVNFDWIHKKDKCHFGRKYSHQTIRSDKNEMKALQTGNYYVKHPVNQCDLWSQSMWTLQNYPTLSAQAKTMEINKKGHQNWLQCCHSAEVHIFSNISQERNFFFYYRSINSWYFHWTFCGNNHVIWHWVLVKGKKSSALPIN